MDRKQRKKRQEENVVSLIPLRLAANASARGGQKHRNFTALCTCTSIWILKYNAYLRAFLCTREGVKVSGSLSLPAQPTLFSALFTPVRAWIERWKLVSFFNEHNWKCYNRSVYLHSDTRKRKFTKRLILIYKQLLRYISKFTKKTTKKKLKHTSDNWFFLFYK